MRTDIRQAASKWAFIIFGFAAATAVISAVLRLLMHILLLSAAAHVLMEVSQCVY